MNYLLSDGDTIPLNPNLAKEIGVNHALVLQQLHFLLTVTRKQRRQYNYVEGRWWIYNTYPEWRRDHFKWLSVSAIKSIFRDLEDAGLVMSMQSVKSKFDRRKWYSINYEVFERLASSIRQILSDENGQFLSDENGQFLSDVYTETTSEKESTPPSASSVDSNTDIDAISAWTQCYGSVSGHAINLLVELVNDFGNTAVVSEVLLAKRREPSVKQHPDTIRRRLQYKPFTDALASVFGYEQDGITGKKYGQMLEAAEQLKVIGLEPKDVQLVYAYCTERGFKDFGLTAIVNYSTDWKAQRKKAKQQKAAADVAATAASASDYTPASPVWQVFHPVTGKYLRMSDEPPTADELEGGAS